MMKEMVDYDQLCEIPIKIRKLEKSWSITLWETPSRNAMSYW